MAASTTVTKSAKARYEAKPDRRTPMEPNRRAEEVRSFERTAEETVVVETGRGWIEYFKNDAPIGHALKDYGEWAEAEITVLCALAERGGTVIDVGANVGVHSLAFARRVGAAGSVIAFEPQGPVCSLLAANMAANGCANVEAVQAGVGAKAGVMRTPDVDYGAQANLGAVALLPEGAPGGVVVPIVTIDGLGLAACDLIKVDAEGMGAEVLIGAADTIRRLRPILAVECNTVAEGVAVFQAHRRERYGLWLLRAAAFNPDNFRRNPVNFFGAAHESTLIFVPDERASVLPASRPGAEFVPVADLDGLAAAVLATPRYGDATPYERDPGQLRAALAHSEAQAGARAAEFEAARDEASRRAEALGAELATTKAFLQQETDRLEFRTASLLKQLRVAEAKLAGKFETEEEREAREAQVGDLRRLLAARELEVAAIRRSTSWRVTAPVRALRTLIATGRE